MKSMPQKTRLVEEELYDLSSDPGEHENLLPEHGDKVGGLRSHVGDAIEKVQQRRAGDAGEQIVVDDELAEKLRALGYVQP